MRVSVRNDRSNITKILYMMEDRDIDRIIGK